MVFHILVEGGPVVLIGVTHCAVGAAVGAICGGPALGAVGGLVSHLVLDSLPHVDPSQIFPPKDGQERSVKAMGLIVVDVSVGLAIVIMSWYLTGSLGLLAGGLMALLPDTVYAPMIGKKIKKLPMIKQIDWLIHEKCHYRLQNDKLGWGWPIPILLTVISLWYLAYVA